jgi:RNA polymerase sigma-70 factor, ECF subfamily
VTSDLVERAQRGDHEAFDILATAAYHRLFDLARRILRDRYAAEDAVQDALVKAWREVRRLRDPGAFDAWLHRLLVNACRDQARRTRRRPIELPALPIDREEPRDDYAQLADRDELERAFLELSIEHRAVLVLSGYVGLPAPEIGRILGIPPGTVASRLHYGARAMRAAIGRERDAAMPATTLEPGR